MAIQVEIPGGIAVFREKRTGKGKKLLRSAGISAATNLSDYPELFEPPREGESDEERAERLAGIKMHLSIEQADTLETVKEATVVALLESWTLDQPLPTSIDDLEELDEELYDALLDAVMTMTDATTETDFSVQAIRPGDPATHETPTPGSSDSDGPSEEQVVSPSTTTPWTDGSPTSGESSSLVL